jgi:hypothetical protein
MTITNLEINLNEFGFEDFGAVDCAFVQSSRAQLEYWTTNSAGLLEPQLCQLQMERTNV